MWTHFNNVVTTQRQLADSFTELGQKSPELQEEFAYNAETQKALVRNGETLLGKSHIFRGKGGSYKHEVFCLPSCATKQEFIGSKVKTLYVLVLAGALNFFISSINTLCNKTMEDTLTTVKAYETAR